ncbi:MAG: Sodium/proton antiporter [Candidatus Magasanikbacteria bacterium GW2011_GWA2_56_11]|uniref:Sodium/proton antiporter n=1 Tax=Candidatus Magasanikbacteria bacterium GW2011_GWA2_56_11 TaxID=1619044 RepID=A0A0G1YEV7_9BACT|nr:MAG: Sodium/proton antiporter [Candidatus Magasanikbacteria bacterium GW2011_GWA2_56_11]
MVLCTIGFFVLLSVLLSGSGRLSLGNSADGATPGTVTPGTAAPSGGSGPKLVDIAKDVGLNVGKFTKCVQDKKFASAVQADEADAQKIGAQGTPFSVVMGPKGDAIVIEGAYPYQTVEAAIKKLKGEKFELEPGIPAPPEPTTGLAIRAVGADEPVKGNQNAKITIVEYSDFECPFCKRYHDTMAQIIAKYGNEVRWVYRHLPLDSLHRKARTEALAAECAGEQGKFWEFTDQVFAVTPSNDGIDITI